MLIGGLTAIPLAWGVIGKKVHRRSGKLPNEREPAEPQARFTEKSASTHLK
jgi:hypothetical protein